MPRLKAAPQRLGSLQAHQELLKQKAAASVEAVRGNRHGSQLDRVILDSDEEDDELMDDGFSALDETEVEEELDRRGRALFDEESEEEDIGGDMRSKESIGGKRRRRTGTRGQTSRLKKKRRRLFKEGRRMELDDDSDDDLDLLNGDLASTTESLRVAIPVTADPDVRYVHIKRSSFEASGAAQAMNQPLATMVFTPTLTARSRLQVAPVEDMELVVLQMDTSKALGLDSEGLSVLSSLCELNPPLAYFEATATITHIHIDIYLTSHAIAAASPSNEPPPMKSAVRLLRRLMELLFPNGVPEVSSWTAKGAVASHEKASPSRAPFYAADLYRRVEEYKAGHLAKRARNSFSEGGDLPKLLVKLRPYQQDAVEWMISRENGTQSLRSCDDDNAPLPHGWIRLPSPKPNPSSSSYTVWYYNPFSVAFSMTPPEPWDPSQIRGGILADEMGLGKTVELLGLVLRHRLEPEGVEETKGASQGEDSGDDDDAMDDCEADDDDHHENVCPCGEAGPRKVSWIQCDVCKRWTHFKCAGIKDAEHAKQLKAFACEVCHGLRRFRNPRQVGATLVVCPELILSQWEEEIRDRTKPGAIKLAIYRGVRNIKMAADRRLLNPDLLGSHDVVLTTFDVLSGDLAHTDSAFLPVEGETERVLRRRKKYRVTPSPLACCVWWRVCLDEAQMIEASATDAAKMALRLKTVYRWCVSGTPIWKGQLDDLYGLMLFLQVEPYDSKRWWRHAVEVPYERGDPNAALRLHAMLSKLMWRTSKRSVKDQLGLLPMTEVTRHLTFSRVERHFYKMQHEECKRTVNDAIRRVRAKVGGKGRSKESVLEKCAAPLLRLRQACCHPQVGAGGLRGNSQSKRILTMDEIHEKLVEDCKVKCEESQRLLLMQLSGLAAVARIQAQIAHREVSAFNHDRFLAEAARFYERALTTAEANRKPWPIDGVTEVTGAPSAGFSGDVAGDNKVASVRLTWELRSEDRDTWLPTEDSPLWAKATFGTGRKVMGLKFSKTTSEDGERELVMPARVRLLAGNSAGDEVFVEAATFNVGQLKQDGPTESWSIHGFHVCNAKTWKLEILSAAGVDEAMPSLVESSHSPTLEVGFVVQFLIAEIEVDALQILHISANLAEVLKDIQPAAPSPTPAGSSCCTAPSSIAAFSDPSVFTSGLDAGAGEYHRIQSRPISERIQWLEGRAETLRRRETTIARQIHTANKHHLQVAETSFENNCQAVEAMRKETHAGVKWWEWVLGQLARYPNLDGSGDLLRRTQLSSHRGNFPGFRDFNGLLMGLTTRLQELESTRKSVLKKIKALSPDPSPAEIAESSNCGVCRKDWGKTGRECRHCRLDTELRENYENILHQYRKQQGTGEEGSHPISRDRALNSQNVSYLALEGEEVELFNTITGKAFKEPCEAHHVLYRVLLGWLRQEAGRRKDEEIWQRMLAEAQLESKTPELLEKERAKLQRMWDAHADLLSKVDEVQACVKRMELADEDENPVHMSEERKKIVVFPNEVASKREELHSEMVLYEGELAKQQKQLQYLRNIAKDHKDSQATDEGEQEECQVCLQPMAGKKITILPCGHRFDALCVRKMLSGRSSHSCPCCRERFKRSQLQKSEYGLGDEDASASSSSSSSIDGNGKQTPVKSSERNGKQRIDVMGVVKEEGQNDEEEMDKQQELNTLAVRGSWGTKVTALVASVLQLPIQDKCLIFSEWDEMLDVVKAALTENSIRWVRLKGERSAGAIRASFREDADLKCLLLNLKKGAKGLTLVEANHVFLLEPVFNAATEAQAINRVHRIGQTKETKVHRFIVRNTIEERVEERRRSRLAAAGGEDSVLSSAQKAKKAGEAEVTLDDYKALFQGDGGDQEEEAPGESAGRTSVVVLSDDEEQMGRATGGSVVELSDAVEREGRRLGGRPGVRRSPFS